MCFQRMFVFSDTGLFIEWLHPLFLSIHKNKFQPPQVHRCYAWKNKEISTEWKYNILKIDWKYSITSHGKCPKYKEDRGINLSWAEVFSAINPFLMFGDNRSHIFFFFFNSLFNVNNTVKNTVYKLFSCRKLLIYVNHLSKKPI